MLAGMSLSVLKWVVFNKIDTDCNKYIFITYKQSETLFSDMVFVI